jgi:hypothetical protein
VALINWRLMSHPINWLTVMVILILAGAFGHYFLTYFGMEPATKNKLAFSQMPAGQSPGEVASGAIDPQSSPVSDTSMVASSLY